MLPRLYAIADAAFGDPVEIARRLFAGGVRLVQVRSKVPASGLLLAQCRAIRASGQKVKVGKVFELKLEEASDAPKPTTLVTPPMELTLLHQYKEHPDFFRTGLHSH